jgi:hypothetical protein
MSDDGGVINAGKFAWDIIKDNRPVVTESSGFANAIPKGAAWEELTAYQDTNHFSWRWNGPGLIWKDFVFDMRINWSFGAHYHGGGAYITNCWVDILNDDVGVGGYHIDMIARTGNPQNVGSPTAPIAELPVSVTLRYSNWLWGWSGTCSFLVRGNGAGNAEYSDNTE